jgi:hypothetical protein
MKLNSLIFRQQIKHYKQNIFNRVLNLQDSKLTLILNLLYIHSKVEKHPEYIESKFNETAR